MCQEVRRTVLIAERVAADDDGLDPSWGTGRGMRSRMVGSRKTVPAEDVADLREHENTSG